MKFYRRLQAFHAISFDLDDTLYSNRPVMVATDQKMTAYFHDVMAEYGVDSSKFIFNARYWFRYRQQAIKQQPALKHDVGLLRERSYFLGACARGLTEPMALKVAKAGLDYFYAERSNFSLPQQTHDLLNALKQRYPLVAITNGNVDAEKINIAQYFSAHFHASIENKRKPDADMFVKTCLALNISPKQLLHVGDCGKNDIYGGVNAGCQTVWLNKYDVGKPLTVLPTMVIDDIEQLRQLL